MSPHRESTRISARHPEGFALLIAIVTLIMLGLCAMALWKTQAGTLRSDRLGRAAQDGDAAADSLLARAVEAMHAGAWRGLRLPGQTAIIAQQRARGSERRATITRLGWQTLLLHGSAAERSGVPMVQGRAARGLLVPLSAPIPMPRAALTGGERWDVDPAAVVDTVAGTSAELACRGGGLPAGATVDTTAIPFGTTGAQLVDPDTVSAPLRGVIRLIRDRISRPMVVEGMVESVTGLLLGADLQLAGVLVVQGSVQSAGGRLDVTGAVITRDSGGGRSVLGNGDRVRYDACAIRRAIERLTRPAPAAAWTIVGHF